MKLTVEEQEVHLSMSADEPGMWHAYTDYPKWQRKLESIGAHLVRVAEDGIGRFYTLPANQVSFRRQRVLSKAHKAQLAERMRAVRQKQVIT